MTYKTSRYNFLILEDDHGILYNSRTGKTVLLKGATGDAINWLLVNPSEDVKARPNLAELKTSLVDTGFLVPHDEDELASILQANARARKSREGLHLTISVTEACNFRCPYCYQSHAQKSIDEKTADRLVEFVRHNLPQDSELSVTWYGGEPLLNLPVIEKLSAEFTKICKQSGCAYSTFMITNGYRLNADMVRHLASLDIGDFQITIDGDKETHDQTRILAGGQGSYDVIMKNLKDIVPLVDSMAVRINVLHSNRDGANRLLKKLDERFDAIEGFHAYLAHVDDASENCDVERSNLLTGEEFAGLQRENRPETIVSDATRFDLPQPVINVCGAERANNFVVDPEGQLFKCWNSVGRTDEPVGSIHQPFHHADRLDENKWQQFSADQDDICRECKFLPLCMGGCPDVRFRTGQSERDCVSSKYTLIDDLTDLVQRQSAV